MKTLNNEQIAALYLFTQQKGIRYYEVQIELVDHLASAIEAEWEEKPALNFEQALQLVYSRFGIFGFDELEDRKAKALYQQQLKRWGRTFLSFFNVPLAILTVLIFLGIQETIHLVGLDRFYITYSLMLMTAGVGYMYLAHLKQKQKQRQKLLLLNFGRTFFLAFNLIWYIPFFILRPLHFIDNWVPALVYTILTVLLLSIIKTRQTVELQAQKLYPAAFR
jgi:hypothetical protein